MVQSGDVMHSGPPVRLDPASAVSRMGIIVLSTDLTTERDAARLVPADQAAVHVTRVSFQNPTTPENLRLMGPFLTQAAALILPSEPLAAIYYSCTAASIVIGDAAIAEAIHASRPGVPVVTPSAAALAAFQKLGVRRVALVTPYLPETTRPVIRYFNEHGLEIIKCVSLGLEDDRDMARISPDTITEAVEAADTAEAEAIFLSCTALPAVGLINALEAKLGKPVVSSNQAALWQMLGHAGLTPATGAPGLLFASDMSERVAS